MSFDVIPCTFLDNERNLEMNFEKKNNIYTTMVFVKIDFVFIFYFLELSGK